MAVKPWRLAGSAVFSTFGQVDDAIANPNLSQMLGEPSKVRNQLKLLRKRIGSIDECHGRPHQCRFCNGKNSVDWPHANQSTTVVSLRARATRLFAIGIAVLSPRLIRGSPLAFSHQSTR